MKNFITTLAALSLMCGTSQASIAQAEATAPATGTCSSANAFIWKHLGGAPFAHTEKEALEKLPLALDHMIAAGCLPAGAKDGVLKMIHDQPNGVEVDGTHKLVTLTNGMHLNFVESAGHYLVNVIVGLVSAGRGLVVGVQAKVWAFHYNGRVYTLYMPLICYNWSLAFNDAPPPPPPPAGEQCYTIRSQFEDVAIDKADHLSFWGPNVMKGDCWYWNYAGETQRHSYRECLDDCNYESIGVEVNGMRLAFEGRTIFAPPPGGRWVEYHVSARFAQSDANMALVCREKQTGQMSCGKMVRFDDYHTRVASIYRSWVEYQKVPAVVRPLIFDWSNCLKHWTH
ncbi:MAG: hypothetical protein JWN49_44 [Parcubacteria group bacterium]|nr:hypothetical protein [Parcubacteria group bacterium]